MHGRTQTHRLGLKKFVSAAALEELCEELGIKGGTRRTVKRKRQADISHVTPYGDILVEKNIAGTKIWMVQPVAMLYHISRSCLEFSKFFKEILSRKPCTRDHPIKVIVYSDEVRPGNQLRHQNARKIQVCYWSLECFGLTNLSNERLWFILSICRSDVVKELPGKMSQFMKISMQMFMEPYDLRSGIILDFFDGSKATIFGRVSILLGDEAALKETLDCKGAAGTFFCALCANICDHKSQLHSHDTRGYLQPSTCLDLDLFRPNTDESVMETLRELSRWKATLPKTRFQKKEQEAGWNLNQNGLLLSGLQIGAASSIMFDWMHVYVASGIWQLEVMQLLTELQRVGITQAMLHRELQAWHWPERISSRSVSGQKIFAKKQEGDSVKCSASEALSVYTVLRCILIRFLRSGQCRGIEDHIDSFVKICRVLDLLQSLKRGHTKASTLHEAVAGHLTAYQKAYGTERWLPKHHYSLHLARLYSFHKTLCSCWTHERRHREIKRYASQNPNTHAGFEKSIVVDALHLQLSELDSSSVESFSVGILDAAECTLHAKVYFRALMDVDGDFEVSNTACFHPGSVCSADDVVFLKIDEEPCVGRVKFFVGLKDSAECWVCIEHWTSRGHNRFSRDDREQTSILPVTCIVDACAWTPQDDLYLVAPSSLFA